MMSISDRRKNKEESDMANLSDEELLFLSNLMHMKEEGSLKKYGLKIN